MKICQSAPVEERDSLELPINEISGGIMKNKGEYYSATHFLIDSSDEELETEFDDKLSVKSEGIPNAPSRKQSIMKQIKSVDDRTAIKDILVTELQKSLSTQTLLARKTSTTTLISDTLQKAKKDMNEMTVAFEKSEETCTIEPSTNTDEYKKTIEIPTNTQRMSSNSWLESKKKLKEQKLKAQKQLKDQKDMEQIDDKQDPMKPLSKNENDAKRESNILRQNVSDNANNLGEPSKESEKRVHSEADDEKKAAAVERSLNAANYLLQNWGFKNRNSLKRIKDDLQKLQYGKIFLF